MATEIDIFISHSHQDIDIAEAFIELFRRGLNVPVERIRCTSVDGYRLPVSTLSIDDQLRREVEQAKVFIAIITPVSLESAYVSFELGARWGTNEFSAPILISSRHKDLLKGPLQNINALYCENRQEIEQFLSRVADKLQLEPVQPVSYQSSIDRLVELSAVPRTQSTIATLLRQLGDVYEVLTRVLTVPQNAHLQTLILKQPQVYRMFAPLRKELEDLEKFGFIEAQPGRSRDDVGDGTDFVLKEYFRLTAIGRSYLRWLVDSN